jgi:hypothetical protein
VWLEYWKSNFARRGDVCHTDRRAVTAWRDARVGFEVDFLARYLARLAETWRAETTQRSSNQAGATWGFGERGMNVCVVFSICA